MPRRYLSQPNKQLSLLIAELLETTNVEATRILQTVLRVVKEALQSGKQVYIKGFGTFKIIERTHRPTPNNILTNDTHGPVAYAGSLRYYQPRRIVIFEPSLPLSAMLNLDTPNYKERRSQLRWRR